VDRIEVSVAHKGTAAPSVGGDVDAAAAGAGVLEGVDEVQHETLGGVVVTRLTKFIKQGAASR
jgi:hypothetical protein